MSTTPGTPSPTAHGSQPAPRVTRSSLGRRLGLLIATAAAVFGASSLGAVASGALSLTGTPTSPATTGTAYSFALTVSGGSASPTVAITSGTLPTGLTLSTAGVISGTPTTAGSYTAMATATDGGVDPPASDTFTIVIKPVVSVAPTTGPPSTPVTVSGSGFMAGENVTVTYVVDPTAVPPTKVTLCSKVPAAGDGTVSCNATLPDTTGAGAPGSHSIFAAGSVSHQSGSTKFVLKAGPLTLSGTPTSPVTAGTAYSFALTVSGGSATPTVAMTSGALPPGLTLSTAGVISGTPSTPGTYSATATASDGGADPPSSDSFSITVKAPPGLSLTGTPTSPATVGAAYSFSLTVSGASGTAQVAVVGGRLPPGLTLSPSGTISGTPSRVGTYDALARATDGTHPPAYDQFGITINPPAPLSLSGTPASPATAGTAYSSVLVVAGGSGTPTVALTSGALPPGLTLSTSGVISGTPVTAGSFTATATATDGGADPPANDSFTIVIKPAVGVIPGSGGPSTPVTVSGSGFVAGESVTVVYIIDANAVPPTKATLCSGVPAAGNGTFSCNATIPAGPGAAGNHSISATGATSHQSGSAKFVLTSGSLTLSGTPTSPAPKGVAYSFALSITGASATPTVTMTSGSLPPGLTLGTNGVISGTPSALGTYTGTATATDGGADPPSSDSFSITINNGASSMDFPTYMHDPAHSAYNAAATAITPKSALQLAYTWTVTSGAGQPGPNLTSTPVVVNHVIYEGSNSGDFYAVDEATGTVVWKDFLGFAGAGQCGNPRGFAATATTGTDPGTGALAVYAPSGDGNLYALKATDGSILWKSPVNVPSPGQSDYFFYSSPQVANGKIYAGMSSNCDKPLIQGGVVALDQATGNQLAVYHSVPNGSVGGGVWSSPAVAPDGSVLATTGNGNNGQVIGDTQSIVRLDGTTLARLDGYQVVTAAHDSDFGASPTIFTAVLSGTPTQMVGACNKDGIYYAWKLAALSAGPVWSLQVGLPNVQSGGENCLAGANWDGSFLYLAGNPTTINGTSYRGSIRKLDPATGTPVWETGLPAAIITSSSLDGSGAIAMTSYDFAPGAPNSAFLVNAADGSFVTISTGGNRGAASAVFADNFLLLGTFAGKLYAYHP